jgi:ubiquilin
MPFQIKIKPTSGGPNIVVSTDNGTSIAELKEAIAADASIPSTEQRLIYKGQVLKNERTVESYGESSISHRLRKDTPIHYFVMLLQTQFVIRDSQIEKLGI